MGRLDYKKVFVGCRMKLLLLTKIMKVASIDCWYKKSQAFSQESRRRESWANCARYTSILQKLFQYPKIYFCQNFYRYPLKTDKKLLNYPYFKTPFNSTDSTSPSLYSNKQILISAAISSITFTQTNKHSSFILIHAKSNIN